MRLDTHPVTFAYVLLSIATVALYASGLVAPHLVGLGVLSSNLDFFFILMLCSVTLAALLCNASRTIVMVTSTLAAFIILTLHQEPLVRYLTLAAILFALGAYGMVVSRNAVRVLISIELMLNAVNINLVAFARFIDPIAVYGQVFVIFTLTVAAAEAAVGLAIVLAIYRNLATVDMEKFNTLKW